MTVELLVLQRRLCVAETKNNEATVYECNWPGNIKTNEHEEVEELDNLATITYSRVCSMNQS